MGKSAELTVLYQGDGFKVVDAGRGSLEQVLMVAIQGGSVIVVEHFLGDPRTREETMRLLENWGEKIIDSRVSIEEGDPRELRINRVMAEIRRRSQHDLNNPRPGNNRPRSILDMF